MRSTVGPAEENDKLTSPLANPDFPHTFHLSTTHSLGSWKFRTALLHPNIPRILIIRRLQLNTRKQTCTNIDKNNNGNNTTTDHSTAINGTQDRRMRTDMRVIPPCTSMRSKRPTALKRYTTSKSSLWALGRIVPNAWRALLDTLVTGFEKDGPVQAVTGFQYNSILAYGVTLSDEHVMHGKRSMHS
jgi:hypothetical protein